MAKEHLSFEFFPPREAEGRHKLRDNVAGRLAELAPDFFSVTYGAGGSTRDGTFQTVSELLDAGYSAAPHLSIGGDRDDAIRELLDRYADAGAQHIVALRGDLPSGFGKRFTNNAEKLVRLIREHAGDRFHVIVAAYPEVHPDAVSMASDLEHFRRKVDAGADSAITQYFYNADSYADFVSRAHAAGVRIPIIPGVMPITNYESLMRFSAKCGADIPRWLDHALQEKGEDIIKFGVEVVTRICERLQQFGAPGFHFYTLNRWGATTRICENLGLAP